MQSSESCNSKQAAQTRKKSIASMELKTVIHLETISEKVESSVDSGFNSGTLFNEKESNKKILQDSMDEWASKLKDELVKEEKTI